MDENISLDLEEAPVVNLELCSIAKLIEDEFINAEDYLCISFKKNYDMEHNYQYENGDEEDDLYACLNYLNESGVAIIASTAGIHHRGENLVTHFHYHLIVKKSSVPKTMLSNASLHRKRSQYSSALVDITTKIQPMNSAMPKFQFLSYPYKEKNPCLFKFINRWKGSEMKKDMIDFLLETGNSLYQASLAKNLIRDKSKERKQNDYIELLNLVRDSGIQFSTFRSLQIWCEENFIEKLSLEKMVDIVNYKKNLQKVGVSLRIVKTYDL